MIEADEFETTSRAEWRAWLEANHATARGVWFISYKKSSGKPGVLYEHAVEEALCFGWIDSVTNRLDDERYKQFFSPRRPRSGWAASNKERVQRLIDTGRMTPAGLAVIEQAKRDGSWNLLDSIDTLTVPDDLAAALAASPAAATTFNRFSPSVRKQLLYHVASAKRPETRAKRIGEIVTAAADGWNRLDAEERKRREAGR